MIIFHSIFHTFPRIFHQYRRFQPVRCTHKWGRWYKKWMNTKVVSMMEKAVELAYGQTEFRSPKGGQSSVRQSLQKVPSCPSWRFGHSVNHKNTSKRTLSGNVFPTKKNHKDDKNCRGNESTRVGPWKCWFRESPAKLKRCSKKWSNSS